MSSTACWKKVWLTITGDIKAVTISEARNVLNLVKTELLEGVTQYKPYKEGSVDVVLMLSSKMKEKGSTLEQFVQKLNLHINLESDVAWKVFCNFLIFQYYGKIEDIQKIAEHELYNTNLFKQLWLFYTSERMYMIKTLKHILENGKNAKHEFQKLYFDFLNEINIVTLRRSLMKQFEYLLDEIKRDNENCCLDFNDWVTRNNREQLEILQSLILTTDYKHYSIEEFIFALDTFKKHNFGLAPSNDHVLTHCNPKDIRTVKLTELAILLLATKSFWEDSTNWKTHNKRIEHKILNLLHQEELSILLLLFISLQLGTADRQVIDKYASMYRKYIKLALDQKVFYSLRELILLPDWKECRAGDLVKQAVFSFLEYASGNFEIEATILNFEYVPDLIAELAKERQFAVNMMKTDGVYNKLCTTMFQMFPYSFVPLSKVTAQLLYHKEIFNLMFDTINNFNAYTEIYTDIPYESELILRQDYNPKVLKSLTIPTGTKAHMKEILGTLFIMFEHHFTYFDILEDRLNAIISGSDVSNENMSLVQLGYCCILPILRNTITMKHHPMKNSVNLAQSVIIKAATRPHIHLELIATCLDVCKLLLRRDAEKITESLLVNNFLPHVVKDITNIRNFFDSNFMNTGLLLLVIQEEISSGKLHLLFSYIDFLKELITLKKCVPKILTPGLVFLFIHVFPLHLNWNYELPSQKQQLSDECLGIILNILQNDCKELQKNDKVAYNFCFQLVVEHIPTIEVLNGLFRMTNTHLHACIMNESNWGKRSSIMQINCLKKVLAIINILLSLHNKGERSLNGTNFFTIFLDSSIKPTSLKLLTGYMQHTFDPAIPTLSCQILKKLALNSDIGMLSLLEMDKYQLQCTFLEKLRDPLEEESLKVAILDLITLCIQKQNGMIVALFDISDMPSTSERIGDTVTAFMEEYLANIRKSTDYLYSPIQAAVLDLFHSLWMYRKNVLVADLAQNESFWTTLMDPLFKDLKLPQKTYSQILNILTYELFCSKGTNAKINQVVEKLFSNNENYVKKWCNHILTENANAQLLRSWKNLLVATCKNYPNAILNVRQRKLLTHTSLEGLLQHFSQRGDIRILSLWAEIYLFLIMQWPAASCKDDCKVLAVLTKLFKHIEECDSDASNHLKEILLSISVKTVKDLRNGSVNDALAIEEYLRAIGRVFENEYMLITSGKLKDIKNNTSAAYSNWLLLITFGTHLLEAQLNVCQDWFKLTQFLNKVLKSIGPFIKSSSHFPIAKIMIQCLIAYARSKLVTYFIYEDLESFFDATRPSERYINTNELDYENAIPWRFEDWWLTYMGVVQLMTLLLQKFGRLILDKVHSFCFVHVDIMRNVMRLPTVTAERSALQLVAECLNFSYALLKWQGEWRLSFPEIYFSYMQSIKETINFATSIILRPSVLKFFTIEKEVHISCVNNLPTNCLVEIMNGLMKIIACGCLCLLRACPSMVNLLEPYKFPFSDDVNVKHVFHIPKIYDDSASQLKYGSLLCLLHFLCKSSQVQKSPSGSSTDLNTSNILPGTGYLVFVSPHYFGGSKVDKCNSLQTFAASELSRLSTKWLMRLDQEKVNIALETLSTFLAVQTYLTIYARPLLTSRLHHIKRELCSELLYFQEFTRKKASDQHQYKTMDNFVYRRLYTENIPYFISYHHGEIFAKLLFQHHPEDGDLPMGSLKIGDCPDERIFYNKDYFTTLVALKSPVEPAKRKLAKMKSRYCGRTREEKILLERVTLFYPNENETHNQGDYLLMLSHWFFHICQLSH